MENLDKSVSIGLEKLQELEAAEKTAAEAKLTDEEKKQRVAAEADRQAKEIAAKEANEKKDLEEAQLLDADESDLNEEQKKKREEILKARETEPDVQKILKALKDANRRIDKLHGRTKTQESEFKKQLEEKDRLIKELQEKMEKGPAPKPEELESQIKAKHAAMIAQYEKEDASKPLAERREMSKEELEEWLDTDPVAANEWLVERRFRRQDELKQLKEGATAKDKAEEFLKRQDESVKRLQSKYPNIRPEKRAKEIIASGKTAEEALAILEKEYPEFKAMNEIMAAHPEYYKQADFGDIVAIELEKRLKTKAANQDNDINKDTKKYTAEEVQKAVEEALKMEQQRRNNIDVGAGGGGGSGNVNLDKLTPEEEALKAELEKVQKKGFKIDVNETIKHHRFRQTQPHLSVEEVLKKSGQ